MMHLLEKYSKISLFFAIIIAVSIFYISSLTLEKIGKPVTNFKAIAYHFLAFFFLVFFLLPPLIKGKKINLLFIIILISIVYALTDEFHQLFVFGRSCSVQDFLIDSGGVLTASFLYIISLNFRIKAA